MAVGWVSLRSTHPTWNRLSSLWRAPAAGPEATMGSCRRSAGLGAAIAALLLFASAARAERVDLLLVLASDVSRSVDAEKFELQRRGYGHAMSDPRVIDAIRSGTHGRIGVCFLEWSGVMSQKLVIDWTAIGDAGTARHFGDRSAERRVGKEC